MRAWVMALLSIGACQFDRPADLGHTVGGSLTGTWDGAVTNIDLIVDGASQSVVREGDGSFVFPTDVADGASYEVRPLAPGHTCEAQNGTGVVAGADITDLRIICHGPQVRLELSTPTLWTFDPDALAQQVAVSTLVGALSIRATHALLTEASLDGTALAPGDWSLARPLAIGPQSLSLRLDAGDLSRTYELIVDRGDRAAEQMIYVKASNGVANDLFGDGLAIDGDRLVVGAIGHDDLRIDGGAFYVFRRDGVTWTEEAYLRPVGTVDREHVGEVAIDGDLIVAGAPGNQCTLPGPRPACDAGAAIDAGAAYVFRRTSDGWRQEIVLKASHPQSGDRFGTSVSIDAGFVIVGAPGEDSAATTVDGDASDDSAPDAGAAFVFTVIDGAWRQVAYLKAANADAGDRFGAAVAIHGGEVIVGAPFEASHSISGAEVITDDSAPGTGAAYGFRAGPLWQASGYFKGDSAGFSGRFGTSIAISADRFVVGAPLADATRGRVYVFDRAAKAWSPAQPLISEDITEEDDFGCSVALAGDLLVVGARGEGAETAGVDPVVRDETAGFVGATYVFRRAPLRWTQAHYLKASNPQGDDQFGHRVAVSDELVCVAAPAEDSATRGIGGDEQSNASPNSGAVYCFR